MIHIHDRQVLPAGSTKGLQLCLDGKTWTDVPYERDSIVGVRLSLCPLSIYHDAPSLLSFSLARLSFSLSLSGSVFRSFRLAFPLFLPLPSSLSLSLSSHPSLSLSLFSSPLFGAVVLPTGSGHQHRRHAARAHQRTVGEPSHACAAPSLAGITPNLLTPTRTRCVWVWSSFGLPLSFSLLYFLPFLAFPGALFLAPSLLSCTLFLPRSLPPSLRLPSLCVCTL